jgi:hypothetical protein
VLGVCGSIARLMTDGSVRPAERSSHVKLPATCALALKTPNPAVPAYTTPSSVGWTTSAVTTTEVRPRFCVTHGLPGEEVRNSRRSVPA